MTVTAEKIQKGKGGRMKNNCAATSMILVFS
jgi:hypothetical protein